MLRRIARWAARRGVAVELVGVDLNPRSELGRLRLHAADLPIRWITGDYADLSPLRAGMGDFQPGRASHDP